MYFSRAGRSIFPFMAVSPLFRQPHRGRVNWLSAALCIRMTTATEALTDATLLSRRGAALHTVSVWWLISPPLLRLRPRQDCISVKVALFKGKLIDKRITGAAPTVMAIESESMAIVVEAFWFHHHHHFSLKPSQ